MSRLIGSSRGTLVMIEPGDSCYSIAEEVTGDPDRWQELIDMNPGRALSELGTFRDMIPGDKLVIPPSWVEFAKTKNVPIESETADAAGLDDPCASEDAGMLPFGWTDSDLKIVNQLAEMWGGTGDDLIVTFYQESGLQPHIVTPLGGTAPDGRAMYEYAGLIEGLASMWSGGKRIYPIDQSMGWPQGTWKTIVTQTPTATQLQAIAQLWDKLFKSYVKGETIGERAERFGVPLHAIIHALNFLPARVSGATSADSPLTQSPENFYRDNAGFDVNKDGKITIRDMATFGERKLAELQNSSKGVLLAKARDLRSSSDSLATLFAPIDQQWEELTGKPPVTTVGYGTSRAGSRGFSRVAILVAIAVLLGVLYVKFGKDV